MPRLTGAEIVAESLIANRVPYVFGIPGHGDVCLFDALVDRKERIGAMMVYHEQSAAHMADAYYRVSGQPCGVFTSIGPGACNTVIGVAQAYVDSTAMLVVTGSTHTYMRGHSVLQELDRAQFSDFPNVLRPVTKQTFLPTRVDAVPFVMHRAFNKMLSGRPGPVHIDLPMDVQAEAIETERPVSAERRVQHPPRPDAMAVEKAVKLLLGAQRPVVLIGGGVITANAGPLVQEIAEFVGAAILTTWMGKGAVPEDHELYGLHPGSPGSTVANELLAEADVVLSFGCRFTDWSFSSYHKSYNMQPDCQLIQIDIDAHEIGKNFPVAVDMVADARSAAQDLLDGLRLLGKPCDWPGSAYHRHIAQLRSAWYELLRPAQTYAGPGLTTISRALAEVRKVLPRNGIVVTGAGLVQNQTFQEFPVYEPRTHISSGGFSTMGFTVPGAIGAKLAAPDRPVIGLAGDGDFLQTMQEIGVAAMYEIPVVWVVMNNCGFSSIRNLQEGHFGKDRTIVTQFQRQGEDYSAQLAEVAKQFGIAGERVVDPAQIGPAVARALQSGGPALIEVMVNKQGLTNGGWWDIPVPAYLTQHHQAWLQGRQKEVL
ncbi:MAG TPA: thiamine pyrophosphate-binding protein [Symbiobacteriaceae bacterium]|nr:thiamine pyrophosphate-binding protein [Symbiobacteriaceae bacterium]